MNKHIRTTATATVLAGIVAGTAFVLAATPTEATSPSAATSAPETETMVLAFPWQGGHQKFIDTGKKGIGPGDLFLGVGMPVLDNATGEQIGTSDAVELIVSGRHDGTVTSQSTMRLPGGHIELDGIVRHTDKPFRATVTGGTGAYLGVRGQITLLKSDKDRKVEVMKLELIR
jgi:hypothetical protein